MGLLSQTVLLRTEVQPDFEPYASHIVVARGWPFAWLVTEPSTPERPLALRERMLVSRFLTCWAGLTAISIAVLGVGAALQRK
jgi:hypothetical protein